MDSRVDQSTFPTTQKNQPIIYWYYWLFSISGTFFKKFLLPASDKAVDVWTKWQFSLEKEQDEEVENKFAVSKLLVLKQ